MTSISFNRNKAQTTYERFIGVSSAEELGAKENTDKFKTHILTKQESIELSDALKSDAIDFFFNGILSFSEGVDSVFLRRFSWATVKLYYAVFYLVRASMAAKNIAILRCKGLSYLKAETDNIPSKAPDRKYASTHAGTLYFYKKLFENSDVLYSNPIGDIDVYQWMLDAREIVNYRSSTFEEPDYLDFWGCFSDCVDEGTLPETLKLLEADNYIKCFQEDFAIMAIPVKRMLLTIQDINSANLLRNLSEEKKQFVKSVIGYDKRSLTILQQIFCH